MYEPERVVEALFEKFGEGGNVCVTRAPGRVNLIGEHTDYNGGFVLPMGLDRDVVVAGRKIGGQHVRVYSCNFDEIGEFEIGEWEQEKIGWLNYIKGVAREFCEQGVELSGMELAFGGDVPVGAGLSSSAALEVAVAWCFMVLSESVFERTEIALMCQRAENEFVGVKCGIMDQFAAALSRAGFALFLDCRGLHYEHVRLPEDVKIVICNTGVKRELAGSEYNKRRAECEQALKYFRQFKPDAEYLRDVGWEEFLKYSDGLPEPARSRARHVITENERVLRAVEALGVGDVKEFGELMYESHESLREDYEASSPELDLIVNIARGVEGVYGARMTGAGFGGCCVAVVEEDAVERFVEAVKAEYPAKTGIEPEIYVCQSRDGAEVVR